MRKQNIEEWEEEPEEFSPGFFTKDHSCSISKHDLGTVLEKSEISQIIQILLTIYLVAECKNNTEDQASVFHLLFNIDNRQDSFNDKCTPYNILV